MNKGFDLRVYKKARRERYRALRKSFSPEEKAEKDANILNKILSSGLYRESRTLLCYVSTEEEIDTHALIRQAVADGKQVAVPYCISGTREMQFYRISSLEELVPRTFGVLEPVAREENKLVDYSGSICILPGIVFDRYGYRLGYGGGYYDRFLSQHYREATLGVCYEECFVSRLNHGRYDVACKLIVTDQSVRAAEEEPERPREAHRRKSPPGPKRQYGGPPRKRGKGPAKGKK